MDVRHKRYFGRSYYNVSNHFLPWSERCLPFSMYDPVFGFPLSTPFTLKPFHQSEVRIGDPYFYYDTSVVLAESYWKLAPLPEELVFWFFQFKALVTATADSLKCICLPLSEPATYCSLPALLSLNMPYRSRNLRCDIEYLVSNCILQSWWEWQRFCLLRAHVFSLFFHNIYLFG